MFSVEETNRTSKSILKKKCIPSIIGLLEKKKV